MTNSLPSRFLLSLGAATALGFGGLGLLNPASTAETVSLQPLSAFGTGEVRAIYGGLWLAMGLVLAQALVAHFRHGWARSGPRERVQAITLCWLGLPLGRLVGLALDGGEGGPVWAFVAAEVAMIGCLAGSLAFTPRR